MMLQALVEYAKRQGIGDPYFEGVGTRWIIPTTIGGQLKGGPIPIFDDADSKKPKPKRRIRPRSDPDFVSHGRSYFLCDSLERCLLFVEDDERLAKRRVNQLYFIGLIEEAMQKCPTEMVRLGALAQFLRNKDEMDRLHTLLREQKASGSDNAVFTVDGIDLLSSVEIQNFWRQRCDSLSAETNNNVGVCLVTGKEGPICRTTGFIKLLGEDTKLISFNKECPAFESFGFSQATNAPVSFDAEVKFCAAINDLIEHSRQDKLVFNDTAYLHWTREAMVDDSMDLFVNPDPEAVRALLESVRAGKNRQPEDDTAYYAMGVSGNGARIVVRDWLESTVGEVKENIAAWFKDLAIFDWDRSDTRHDFKFGELLYAMVRARKPSEDLPKLPAAIPTQLFHAAIHGGPLPMTALAAALRRQQVETENKLNPARLALIKACLLRSPNRKPTDTMSEKLDPESKDHAYRCGQLFAIIGRLQLLALGKIGASIAERTYGGVATHPATTFGPLFTKVPAYLKKANTRFPGSGTNKQKEIETVCSVLDGLGGFPNILKLEEQGRFALGYYCQLAQYRSERSAADEAKLAEDMADDEG